MTTDTQVSYNSDTSQIAATPATIYEVISRIEVLIEDGRVRGTGRSMLKASEAMGLVEDLKRELPKITSLSDQIMMKRDQMLGEAEQLVTTSKENSAREAAETRRRAEDERNIIIAQAKKQANELLEKSALVKASNEEAAKVIEEAKEEAEKIILRSKREANTIIDVAEERAYRQVMETDEYSRKLLMKLEERLSQTIMQIRHGIDAVNESMEEREKEHARLAMNAAHNNHQ